MSTRAITAVWDLPHERKSALSPASMIVLLLLADHADSDGTCHAGQPYIVARTGLGLRTVKRCVATLQDAGLVEMESHARAVYTRALAFRHRVSTYRLTFLSGHEGMEVDSANLAPSPEASQGPVDSADLAPSPRDRQCHPDQSKVPSTTIDSANLAPLYVPKTEPRLEPPPPTPSGGGFDVRAHIAAHTTVVVVVEAEGTKDNGRARQAAFLALCATAPHADPLRKALAELESSLALGGHRPRHTLAAYFTPILTRHVIAWGHWWAGLIAIEAAAERTRVAQAAAGHGPRTPIQWGGAAGKLLAEAKGARPHG